jgi:hypothetical protein
MDAEQSTPQGRRETSPDPIGVLVFGAHPDDAGKGFG